MARRIRRLRRRAAVGVTRVVRTVAAAPRVVVAAVRQPRKTFRAFRQSAAGSTVIDYLLDNALEAAGGATSAAVDAYVAMTGTKTDDEYAPFVKILVNNGLKYASKFKGGKALRTFATAGNGHTYGELISRKALEAFGNKPAGK